MLYNNVKFFLYLKEESSDDELVFEKQGDTATFLIGVHSLEDECAELETSNSDEDSFIWIDNWFS